MEYDDDKMRVLIAQTWAHSFLLGRLLRDALRGTPTETLDLVVEAYVKSALPPQAYEGLEVDFDTAERLSDVAVLMQQHVRFLLEQAASHVKAERQVTGEP